MINLSFCNVEFSSSARNRIRNTVIAGFIFLTLVFVTSCSVNPATGSANLVLMSENKEKEIGQEEHEKVLSSQSLFEDEELLAYVTEVGNRVAKVSHRPNLEYTFNIIDSPDINAFALPAGYVLSLIHI